MSNINGAGKELFAWERWLLGWLDDTQIDGVCADEVTDSKLVKTFHLLPIEQIEFYLDEKLKPKKIIVIKLDNHTALIAELRCAIGYDENIKKPGVLVIRS